jgi:antagonist of KipI
MSKGYFKILRPGINSTFQDLGRFNLHHIGIPLSGVMDKRNYLIGNKLVENSNNISAIEFAYQGPLLKLQSVNVIGAITGNVNFRILRANSNIQEGRCYETFELNDGDQIDIISTNKSVYGYFFIKGGFELDSFWKSYSINTKAKIGPNDGNKFILNQKLLIKNKDIKFKKKKIEHLNSKIEFIRVLKGTNFNYFSEEAIDSFFNKEFIVSKLTDRMGMRIEGPKIENIVETNIRSEGLIKGVIQVPGDGNPIIMLSDYGTIGGYPKIGVVISADHDRLAQLTPGSKIKFKLVELSEAENLYKLYEIETKNILNQIR